MTVVAPRLTLERRLLREYDLVVACDEVGRGALAGPVAVGAVAIGAAEARRRVPEGLRDSKLVSEARRPAVAERAASWVAAHAIGWSDSTEIDAIGIMAALRHAALRAIDGLRAAGVDTSRAVVVLDGNHDYIRAADLVVRPVIKADRDCASAAAASVVAKVARDDLMRGLHVDLPAYGWERNKGYASAAHRAAIDRHGLTRHHRASWAIAPATLW